MLKIFKKQTKKLLNEKSFKKNKRRKSIVKNYPFS